MVTLMICQYQGFAQQGLAIAIFEWSKQGIRRISQQADETFPILSNLANTIFPRLL